MPFELSDPTAVRFTSSTSYTPAQRAMMGEGGDARAAITTRLEEQRKLIEANLADARSRAEAGLAGADEFRVCRDVGNVARAAVLRRDAEARTIARDANLSASGRETKRADRDALLQGELSRIATDTLGTVADRLLRNNPEHPLPVLSGDLAANCALVYAASEKMLPLTFLADGTEVLGRALGPATTADAEAANALLLRAYGPLAERFAAAPPNFWNEYVALAGEFAELARLHLDVAYARPRARLAVEAVRAWRNDFTYMANTIRQLGVWDDTICIGATSYAWSKSPVPLQSAA
jgi:hypothetical protein